MKCIIPTCDDLSNFNLSTIYEHLTAVHDLPKCPNGCTELLLTWRSAITHLKTDCMKKCVFDTCDVKLMRGCRVDHFKTVHGAVNDTDESITCSLCVPVHSIGGIGFESHIKSIQSKRTIICDLPNCTAQFKIPEEHYRNVHNFPDCVNCGQKFKIMGRWKNHVKTCQEQTKIAICDLPNCTAQLNIPEEHYRNVHYFPDCVNCGQKFKTMGRWKLHMASCQEIKPCPYTTVNVCAFIAPSSATLTAHISEVHPSCPKCEHVYSAKMNHVDLTNHLALCFNGEGRYSCNECGEAVGNFQKLKNNHFCGDIISVEEFFSTQSLGGFFAFPGDVEQRIYIPIVRVDETGPNRGLISRNNPSNLRDLPPSFRWLRHDNFADGELLVLFALAEHALKHQWILWILLVDNLLDILRKKHMSRTFRFIKYTTPDYVDRKFEDPTVLRRHVASMKNDFRRKILKTFTFRSGRPSPYKMQKLKVIQGVMNAFPNGNNSYSLATLSAQKLPMAAAQDTQSMQIKQNCANRRNTEPIRQIENEQLIIVVDFLLQFQPVYAFLYGINASLLPFEGEELNEMKTKFIGILAQKNVDSDILLNRQGAPPSTQLWREINLAKRTIESDSDEESE